MIRYIFVIILVFSLKTAFNQTQRQIDKEFKEQGLKLIIKQGKTGVYQLLINDTKNNSTKSFKLDNDIDRNIGVSYFGERKFAVISGRYSFYIINLSKDTLLGPFLPSSREERTDAQSGALHSFSLLNNAQYLILGAFDDGVYCYNITNINKPYEVEMFHPESKYFKSEFFFLDKFNVNSYNGIISSLKRNKQERWEIDSKFLFQEYRMKENSDKKIIKKLTENRYLVLNRIFENETLENIIIDLEAGKILKESEDSELINRLTTNNK